MQVGMSCQACTREGNTLYGPAKCHWALLAVREMITTGMGFLDGSVLETFGIEVYLEP